MRRQAAQAILRFASLVPGIYSIAAFFAGRRAAVRGASMQPILAPGERVIFDRLAYVRARPRRGDIVLATHLQRPGVHFVKRVAGVPGDVIAAQDGRTLGAGEYFLLGDNPAASTDSRDLGPFRRRDILARAWIVYWPPERARFLKHE